jgi:hypothetical protein
VDVESGKIVFKFSNTLPPFSHFLKRLGIHLLIASIAIGFSLGLGMVGFRHFEAMSWRDAYVNAAMLLSGMGPMRTTLTESGKIFAGTYALYSGLVFIIVAGIVVAPVLHRLFHYLHLEEQQPPE